VWISEQTAIISLYNINWLVCITETECVYCAVRTESLYTILHSAHTAVFMCFVWISEQTAIVSLYSINWLVCITETKCAYCAVRTEYAREGRHRCHFALRHHGLEDFFLICERLLTFVRYCTIIGVDLLLSFAHLILRMAFSRAASHWSNSQTFPGLDQFSPTIISCVFPPLWFGIWNQCQVTS